MFNQGLYFQTLDLTKTKKVLLNLGLECFVIRVKGNKTTRVSFWIIKIIGEKIENEEKQDYLFRD